MIDQITIPPQVAAGAQVLDEKIPGWYRRIDPSTLVMSDACNCICGQLAGKDSDWDPIVDYLYGHPWHNDEDRQGWLNFVEEHGFTGDRYLRAPWLSVIQARLEHDALPTEAVEAELAIA